MGRRGTVLMGALPTGMFPLLQRPDKSKAAKAAAREALALPEEVQEQVELRGSTALTTRSYASWCPRRRARLRPRCRRRRSLSPQRTNSRR